METCSNSVSVLNAHRDGGVCFRPHMSAIRQENFSENISGFFLSLVRFDVFFQTCGEKKPAEISQRCLFLVQMLK